MQFPEPIPSAVLPVEAEQQPGDGCFREVLQLDSEAWGGGDSRGGPGCGTEQHPRRESLGGCWCG